MKLRHIVSYAAMGAMLCMAPAMAAPNQHHHNTNQNARGSNGVTGRNAGNMQRITGVIVDYLAYITGAGTRGPLMTGNNGGGGNGGGGNGGGGNNGGNGGGMRPLGILTNGHVYLIDLPAQHSGLSRRIGSALGRRMALLGHTFHKNGSYVFVVDAME